MSLVACTTATKVEVDTDVETFDGDNPALGVSFGVRGHGRVGCDVVFGATSLVVVCDPKTDETCRAGV